MPDDRRDVLTEAIARNWAVVISLPSAGMLRHHKSRFLASEESAQASGIWLECPPDIPLVDELIATQKPAGVSFKGTRGKIVFAAPLLKRIAEYRLNADMVVSGLLIQRPGGVKEVQRRATYRVAIPADADLHVRLWRIGLGANLADMPMAAQELSAQLQDISTGGLGLSINGAGQDEAMKLTADDRVRIMIEHQGQPLLLEGTLCHKPTGSGLRWGIVFKGLENDLDGRQKLAALTRIIGDLQREELRRMRLGLSAG